MELIKTKEEAIKFFQRIRWQYGLICSKCGSVDESHLHSKTKNGFNKYQCICKHVFSDISDTCLHKSRTDIRIWFYALFELSQKKSISSCELAEKTNIRQNTAWNILDKLRSHCLDLIKPFEEIMMRGVTETDEAHLGKSDNSLMVQGLVQRGQHAIIKVINDRTELTLKGNIEQHIQKHSYIITDTASAYGGLCCHGYRHFTLNHSKNEFSKGRGINSNTIEGLWGNLKKVIYGTHHGVSKKNIMKYVSEFLLKYNHRQANNSFSLFLNLFFAPPLTC
jgi:hypothetical protein